MSWYVIFDRKVYDDNFLYYFLRCPMKELKFYHVNFNNFKVSILDSLNKNLELFDEDLGKIYVSTSLKDEFI